MKPTPILFLSDSLNLPTGLARITKDLAVLTSQLPQFRVGVMGRGGIGSSRLPFAQFNFDASRQWGENDIQQVWEDFAADARTGVIMTVWDPSRLGWFAQPRMDGALGEFLRSNRFARWGYFPVDSYGVGGKLTGEVRETLQGYDRVLAYTLFGKQVLEQTLVREVDWIPHGYNADVFKPRDKTAGRLALGFGKYDVVVGCVMTNQARKDWATAFGAIAYLKNHAKAKFWLWAHVDVLQRYWDLRALAADFGVEDSVRITLSGEYNSEQLSYFYSACDVTMLPSLGEGWGFPITESLACGVPCVHGNYGGGVEQLPDRNWLVQPSAERLDGLWNNVRPVWNPKDWADKLAMVLEEATATGEQLREVCTASVECFQWGKLWPSCWKKWMLEGIGQ